MVHFSTHKIALPGSRVSIGEIALHAQLMGQGKPTVVFENGLGGLSLHWFNVQLQIAQWTQTLSYDRAWQGWSDPSSHPRTSQ